MSKKREKVEALQLNLHASSSDSPPTSALSSAASSPRRSILDDGCLFDDANTPPVSPKPLYVANGSSEPGGTMTREQRIAALLARAAPKRDGQSTTLERGSSFPATKPSALVQSNELSTVATDEKESSSPEPIGEKSPRKKLERSVSYTPKSPRPLSSPVTLITAAVSSLTRVSNDESGGGKARLRRNSFSGTSPDIMPKGTFTRIIYFRSPLAILEPPKVFVVPNTAMTEGMRAALAMAHSCEFGIGVGANGENEADLKTMAIHLIDADSSFRRKSSSRNGMSGRGQAVGERGVLAQYVQPGAPEINIAQTTITHEYIFKNAV